MFGCLYLQGPGPRAAYVAMSRFMQRYKGYDYAWVVEYDARCSSPHTSAVYRNTLEAYRKAGNTPA